MKDFFYSRRLIVVFIITIILISINSLIVEFKILDNYSVNKSSEVKRIKDITEKLEPISLK